MSLDLPERVDDRRAQLEGIVPAGVTDEAVSDAWARAIWSLISEPGDGVAGHLVAALGAEVALNEIRSKASARRESRSMALTAGLRRWLPRLNGIAVDGMFRTARFARLRLVTPDDADWPRGLEDLGAHAPILLWVRGRGEALSLRGPRVALVGARASSAYGELVAGELAADLADRGVCVVSGAAFGIDGAAHRAALGTGGTTIAVLAGGVDRPYPTRHSEMIARIADHGAVIGEVAPGAAPTKSRFLERNRLIAAMSDATVVVEAGWRSGSLNTAGHAAALGRPLGAVPGPITSATSAGCHRMLREFDATCVTSAADIIELTGWETHPLQTAARPVARDAAGRDGMPGERTQTDGSAEHTPSSSGTTAGRGVLDALGTRTRRSSDEIARRVGLAPTQVEAQLGLFELEGLVMREDGGWRRAAARPERG
ncbi:MULTISPECIES: DNA-processing protein DprA [Bacteria]